MKSVQKSAAQGDVLFRKVAKVPTGFKLVAIEKSVGGNEEVVVSHSETGHHHVAASLSNGLEHFVAEGTDPEAALVCYLRMTSPLDEVRLDGLVSGIQVTHMRPYDTHEALCLAGQPGDVWEVRRQREFAPEGWRRVQD